MYSQTTRRRSASTGRFRRNSDTDRVHCMLQTWASEVILSLTTSQGQGYAIMLIGEGCGLPPHSLIPFGLQYSSDDSKRVEDWLWQASDVLRRNTVRIYIEHQKHSKDQKNYLLNEAAKFIFRRSAHR